MLIDTHCHLDAPEFDHDRIQVIQRSYENGVRCMVVPAVACSNFQAVIDLAVANPACVYALGIHPLYVQQAQDADLDYLRTTVATTAPVAIGEIGLDFYVEGLDRERQAFFFTEQLKIARDADLPVILHVRKSIDDILKHLRRIPVKGGIAHAFNGSRQQADMLIEMGFKLGFGGAMTYPPALRIRELAEKLPLEAIVLETDSPDIPPVWLGHQGRNTPQELPKIAAVLAEIRGESIDKISITTTQNAQQALPKLAQLCTPPHVLL